MLAATAALGGFELVAPPSDEPIAVAVGEEFNGGPWLVTVESAQIGYNLRGHGSYPDRALVLQVNARIEIVDHRTRYVFGLDRILTLQGVTGVKENSEDWVSLRDNSGAGALQPGLPERVAFLWELEPGSPVPDEVTVLVTSLYRRYVSWSFLGAEEIEHDGTPAAVRVPVLDRTGTT